MDAQLVLGAPELQRDGHQMLGRENAQRLLTGAYLDRLPDGLLVKRSGGGQYLHRDSGDDHRVGSRLVTEPVELGVDGR